MYNPYCVAAERIREGVIPLSNFSPKYGVTSTPENQTELRALFEALGPPAPSLAVRLHGDPCLPNWITREGQITGVVDVGKLCVGPRGLDVALAAWSVGYNLGPQWREYFLERYRLGSSRVIEGDDKQDLGSAFKREVHYYTALCRFIS